MFDDQPNTNQPTPPANLPTEPEDMFADVDNSAPAAVQPPNAISAGLLKPKPSPAAAPASTIELAPEPPMPTPPMSQPAENILPTPTVEPQAIPEAPAMYSMKEPILGKIILFVIFGALFAGLGYGGWWAYNNFIKVAPAPVEQNVPVITAPIENVDANLPESNVVPEPELPVAEIISTTTTVSNEVNQQMKNDQILFGEPIDSDKDGLDDVRERELNTNPNNSDTDADGLSDSDEVLIWKTNPLNPDTDGDSYKDGQEVRNGYNPLGPGKLVIIPPGAVTSTTSTVIKK